jgi:serine-type D-Ala-D-Ala carboxypeptidase (penicillin-binding protein 5/6)
MLRAGAYRGHIENPIRSDNVAAPTLPGMASGKTAESAPQPQPGGTRTRYFRTRGSRLRKALSLGRVAIAALLVLAALLVRGGDGGPGGPERISSLGRASHLAWPPEGEAAAAVGGIGSLGASGGGSPVPIASLAKVMTAYLVLKEDPLGPGEEGFELRITPGDVEDLQRRIALGQSVVAVEAGEVLSERQALEALLLPSANNVAALLAIHEAGSVEAFVAEMNEAAAELGMEKTDYTDPSGFEDTTVSTAADQLKIGRAAMADSTFAEIVAMPSTVLPVAGEVSNYNQLVGQEGFIGIKTGSDEAAGGCLLFAKRIRAGGRTLTMVGAVLGQREGDLVEAALTAARSLGASAAATVRG